VSFYRIGRFRQCGGGLGLGGKGLPTLCLFAYTAVGGWGEMAEAI